MQRLFTPHGQRGYPLLVLFAIVVIAMIVTILPVNTAIAAAHGPTATCDGGTLVRRLMLVDEAHNDRATLDVAIAEADAIWATAGVRLVWVPIGADAVRPEAARSEAARPDAYVMLRQDRLNVRRERALIKSRGSRELGWVRYTPDGRRANLIEVSLPAVRAVLMNGWYVDKRLRSHPRVVQAEILGRALGRVIAHEIGHWLIGLGHSNNGLMQPFLRAHDLMHHQSPRLPLAWTTAGAVGAAGGADAIDGRLALLRARCA